MRRRHNSNLEVVEKQFFEQALKVENDIARIIHDLTLLQSSAERWWQANLDDPLGDPSGVQFVAGDVDRMYDAVVKVEDMFVKAMKRL